MVLAAGLRFYELGDRPMHADEATGAKILSVRIETGDYKFDPKHFHGPLLSLTTQPFTHLSNETSWRALEERTLRIQPALAGLLLVLTPLLFVRWTGMPAALAGGLLIAISPLMVYYSRMYIHETTLCLIAACMLASLLRWIEKPTHWRAVLTGICAGLLAATKETVVISLFAWLAAWVLSTYFTKQGRPEKDIWISLPIGLLCGIIVAIFLYTNGFKNPQGALDAVLTYFIYETTPGHDKPFYYYICLLLCPKLSGGVIWWEGMAAIPGLIALSYTAGRYAGRINHHKRFAILFLSVSALLHLLIYSLIPYKTPWLMMVPWMHVLLLAPFGFLRDTHRHMAKTASMIIICLIAGFLGFSQAKSAITRYSNDTRNPYAYVPTTKSVTSLQTWLSKLIQPGERTGSISVIGHGYWPLPWYLREFDKVGYWADIEEHHVDAPVIIVMPALFQKADGVFGTSHTSVPRSLRENHPMMVFIRNDIWENWMKEENS